MFRRLSVALLAALSLVAVPAAQADPRPPVPSADPFYTPPSPLPEQAGTLIRSRAVDWYPEPFRVFKAPVHTYLMLHRSTSALGAPNAVSGLLVVPPIPWHGDGPRPVVAYAMGTQGLGDQCAPSYHMRTGTEVEIAFIAQAMTKGWAVAVTDYEGLGTPGTHTFATGQSEGRALLDTARAALQVPGAGLDPKSPVGIFGYSQGGQAAAFAAELHGSYAPELNVVGSAPGGVPADLPLMVQRNEGNFAAGLVLAAAVGLSTAYPDVPFGSVLNERGKELTAKVAAQCVAGLSLSAPFVRLNDLTTRPDVINDPAWQRRLAENKAGQLRPDAPVYLYHAQLDELVPLQAGKELRARYCALGTDLQWTEVPLQGHITGVSVWGTAALNWLGDRFAGKPTRPDC
ncbi:lipase [Pseudonocardiaceae bacterium YIM PH 21723]|nr:lipase [Pseudonocardiaceae bacterium YIM PH 21723]